MRRRRQKRAIAAQVSIHASVKDATWFCRWLSMLGRGFNPRICKRCDFSWSTIITIRISFNPRICKRCDKGLGFWPYIYSCFNPRICKRCDQKPTICYKTYFGFNPRICKRCDQYSSPYLLHVPVSIHASVKDATYTKSMVLLSDWRFNPRICKRCDSFVIPLSVKNGLFQSTHL